MPPRDGPSAVECTAITARSPDGASATNTTCSWPITVISSVTAPSVSIHGLAVAVATDGTVPRTVLVHGRGKGALTARVKVGVQLAQQDTTIDELRRAWQEADEIGVDSIWVWDHFFPLYGDPDANHFEAYSLLSAMAVDTSRARFGALVTRYAYRNPNLLADLARTLHRLSGERFVRNRLGLVRARLPRVRLRDRDRCRPPARARPRTSRHQGAPGRSVSPGRGPTHPRR